MDARSLGPTRLACSARSIGAAWAIAGLGCSDTAAGTGGGTSITAGETSISSSSPDSSSTGTTTAAATASTSDGHDATGTTHGPIFDVGAVDDSGGSDTGTVVPSCKVGDDIDAAQPCVDVAPPDSFEPDVQWAWPGNNGELDVLGTPVVANLTDDNGDGEIDLCDIPDVVVIASTNTFGGGGHLYLLDGATGTEHLRIETPVQPILYPALGDLDGDGIAEIVAATPGDFGGGGFLLAFHADGSLLWQSPDGTQTSSFAISLADLDADGDVEIIFAGGVYDHTGHRLWTGGASYLNTAADLDDDGDLEVIMGGAAYQDDGAVMWSGFDTQGHPHVADLDQDGSPEVMFVSSSGITIVDANGVASVSNAASNLAQWRPAAVHDMDGDGAPEIAVGSSNTYSVLETNLVANWTAAVSDGSGYAAGTAFDFLGDAAAEAMYADETTLFIFDDSGTPLLTTPRSSWTQWENPIVVDVDNDGSAEIVVASNGGAAPPVQVIRDIEDRWIPARRIWNQHAYHVTNVREDGTIPTVQPKNWDTLNTFRTQAQIGAGGGVCMPEPRG
ncbi:MAG: VCBS repeat-containing protein [Deltaproteobacteria bacterium]|nr:VCBS repeat-containing protein [Deltaproteobacteria bacterium]MBK8235586.1 VCBS repeat-containing protein [Deltaproteobacteria bacterium]MBK8713219.1 VCBS repeat-containing protein [Deltaproteobacteria bacterium]MBP7288896.1 VCBS repeat-containing protein [Nannocystaceae bacterium]